MGHIYINLLKDHDYVPIIAKQYYIIRIRRWMGIIHSLIIQWEVITNWHHMILYLKL